MPSSFDLLVRENPTKTGKEITDIYNQEVKTEQAARDERNKDVLALIKDYNENGAFFKGVFGQDQYYIYKCYNFSMEDSGRVYMDVDKIILFNGDNKKEDHPHFQIEMRHSEYEDASHFALDSCERITSDVWEDAVKYITEFRSTVWDKITGFD